MCYASPDERCSMQLTFPVHELTMIGGDDDAAIVTLRLI